MHKAINGFEAWGTNTNVCTVCNPDDASPCACEHETPCCMFASRAAVSTCLHAGQRSFRYTTHSPVNISRTVQRVHRVQKVQRVSGESTTLDVTTQIPRRTTKFMIKMTAMWSLCEEPTAKLGVADVPCSMRDPDAQYREFACD
jgi:hypothetical protein